MHDITFITGNAQKAYYLEQWLQLPVGHQKLDLEEIQSLDPHAVVEHKVRQAYAEIGKPVLVEDVSLVFTAMGRLPGTFIKWFIEDLGLDGLCQMAQSLEHQEAECRIIYALYDGSDIRYFEASQTGVIPAAPRGDPTFGWNPIFKPDGTDLTYGEMDASTYEQWNIRAHAIAKLREYLTN